MGMRKTQWLVMAGLLSVAGIASAQDAKEEAKSAAGKVGEESAEGAQKAGSNVSQAIREGSQATQGAPSPQPRGFLKDGDRVRNTVTTDPVNMVLGEGLNLQYSRPLSPKISGVAQAHFSRTRAAEGSLTNLGVAAGADFYIIGQNNEGLKIGPKVEVGMGAETIGDNSAFGAYGVSGEVGYDWIASNGLSAGLGAGVRTRIGIGGESARQVNVSPLVKLNVGYSW
jgi:hypothetical protein